MQKKQCEGGRKRNMLIYNTLHCLPQHVGNGFRFIHNYFGEEATSFVKKFIKYNNDATQTNLHTQVYFHVSIET